MFGSPCITISKQYSNIHALIKSTYIMAKESLEINLEVKINIHPQK